MPGRVFQGVIARNAAGLLHPGLFVSVTLSIPRATPGVVVPAGAIIFNADGLRVATVDDHGIVRMLDVTIYRDFGTSVELRNGLQGGEHVVVNPPAGLRDGEQIRSADSGKGGSDIAGPDVAATS
ncbi:MAG TPA: hypothetical protein VGH36_12790 [Acetobacteraceae bacterium]|jgi:multidrug efflux pump subunit AcrA (membrane-fusion protein)